MELEGRLLLTAILFDPDGPGPLTPADITGNPADPTIIGFDFSVGNVLSQGAVTAINSGVGSRFQLFYQSTLSGFRDADQNFLSVPGLNDPLAQNPFEITAVASVTEEIVSVDPLTGAATFRVVPDQAPESFFRLYFDSNPSTFADPLAGTGFTDGTLILTGDPVASTESSGVFTLTPNPVDGTFPWIVPFDQFPGIDHYPNISTVSGQGAATVVTETDTFDPAFFLTSSRYIEFRTDNSTPFSTTEPSMQFSRLDGAAFLPVMPAIGPINGISGPDFQFAADANTFFRSPGINIVKLTNGTDNDTPTGPIVPVGSTVTFTYNVTNTGDLPLNNVVVTDFVEVEGGSPVDPPTSFTPTFVGGDTNGNGLLDLDEIWVYTAQTIAQAGQYSNVATVTGTDQFGGTVSDENPDNHFGSQPGISIIKLTNGTDNDTPTGPVVPVGSTVTFTYNVRNTGNLPLSNVVVTDFVEVEGGSPVDPPTSFTPTFVGGDTNGNGLLDLDEIWVYTAQTIAQAGQYSNLATVVGTPPPGGGPDVTDDNPDNHFGATPGINIEKFTNGQDADTPTGPVVPVGCPVVFTYVVTNPGTLPLSNVTVRDDNGTPGNPADDFTPTFTGGDTNDNGLLDPGEAWTYQAPTPHIATLGQYTNIATVTGTDQFQNVLTDADESNHLGVPVGINIEKTTEGSVVPPKVDQLVRLGFHHQSMQIVLGFTEDLDPTRAQNLANYRLLTAGRDGRFGTADDREVVLQSAVYNASNRTVALTTAGPNPLHQKYQLIINGTAPNGLTNTDGVLLDGNGDGQPGGDFVRTFGRESFRISFTRNSASRGPQAPSGAIGPVVPVGSPVTFRYTVTNTGQLPLSNVVVRDDGGTPNNPADDFMPTFVGGDTNGNGLLDLGEVWTYTAARIATPGQYTNVATSTALAAPDCPVTDSDTSNHFGLCPEIVDLKRHGIHHQPTRIVLTYNGSVDPAQAEDLSNYTITTAGRDGRFGTADDREIAIRSAVYDAAAMTVTLTPVARLNIHHLYQVTARNACPGGPDFVGLLNRKFSLGSLARH